jgi:hypothetical protein
MKVLKELLGVFAILLTSILLATPALAGFAGKGELKLTGQLRVGPWVSKSGIQIAPIYLYSPDYSLGFTSMDEASRNGDLEVTETGTVNELLFENNSRKPILLLAGEVVRGGRQDRMVGTDMILPPGKTRKINVFCVEHGRWTDMGDKGEFKSPSVMADKALRQKAEAGGGRAGNQGAVWDEVEKSIDEFKAAAPTQNYREIMKTEKFKDGEGIIDRFHDAFANDHAEGMAEGVAGFALAYNGEVQSIEYFASPAIFSKYKDKLIRSYVTSALKNMQESSPVDLDEVKDFISKSLSKDTHQYTTDSEIVIESRSGSLESYELLTPKLKSVHYVRYVGASDEITPKPHPEHFQE